MFFYRNAIVDTPFGAAFHHAAGADLFGYSVSVVPSIVQTSETFANGGKLTLDKLDFELREVNT